MKKARFRSIQSKTMLLTIAGIVATMAVAVLIGSISMQNLATDSAKNTLSLLAETGQKNLDSYFKSVEQSVEMVSTYAKADLENLSLNELNTHVENTRKVFGRTAMKTNGVLTYYYRIDPTVSADVKGFWYIDLDHNGFVEHEVTDISKYDTTDTTQLVWFTVPKATGKAVWLPPYVTDNLDVYVLSYNVPIYRGETFVGVVGIEIDYSTMANNVKSINLYRNGYAYVTDQKGALIYHPVIDVTKMTEAEKAEMPKEFGTDSTIFEYEYKGVRKMTVWVPLSNGMRLTVAVPVSEIYESSTQSIWIMVGSALGVLAVFIALSIFFSRHFTKPLRELTKAAESINQGNYEVSLDYRGNDEMGVLTHTFNRLINHLRGYISDLNSLAYADALTHVSNKGAFDLAMNELQEKIDRGEDIQFAIGVFDCDNLKVINDFYGHDKGNIYLKNSSHLIVRVFKDSPVFRIGGDEFATILMDEDYANRDKLKRHFLSKSNEISSLSEEPWEEIRVSVGIAAYDGKHHNHVEDVFKEADHEMYENKRQRKKDLVHILKARDAEQKK